VAPGWKTGGWPDWSTTSPRPVDCPTCGRGMNLLLQIDSTEWDGGTDPRWQPVEDRHLRPGTPEERPAREPTGIVVGCWGALRVFVCQTCPDAPWQLDLQ
jgi:hypothetical protein